MKDINLTEWFNKQQERENKDKQKKRKTEDRRKRRKGGMKIMRKQECRSKETRKEINRINRNEKNETRNRDR